jgi:hypothetical protein
MANHLQKLVGCVLLLLPSCFQAQSTFGYPCVVNEDCDGGQLCVAGVCESAFGVADSTGGTTGDATGDSMGETTSAPDDSSSESTGEPSDDGASDTGGETMEAMARLVHAAPDLGPVDVYAAGDSVPLVGGLDYADASDWLTVDAGDYTFEFRAGGADPGEPALFVSEVVTVVEGASNSIVAAGLTMGAADDELRLVTVQEEWGTSLADRARIRVIHAGSDAPSLTVAGLEGPDFIVDRFDGSDPDGVAISTTGGDRIGLLDSDGLRTSFTTPPLIEGDQVLLVATGLFGSLAREEDGFALVAVGDQGALGRIRQDPQVFTVHGARDAAVLENCTGTGGTAVAANLSYGEVQNAFVSPGEYNFEVHNYPSGCTGALNPGGTASGPLEAGERYMLLLTGEVTPVDMEPGIQVAPFQERFTLDGQGVAQVRFIHGASFTQIYVGAVTDGEIKEADVLTAPIAWRSESQEQTLPEGSYVLGAADAGIPFAPPLSPLVTFDAGVSAGARLWGIVTGDPSIDDADDQFLQVMIVNTAVPGWSIGLIDVN